MHPINSFGKNSKYRLIVEIIGDYTHRRFSYIDLHKMNDVFMKYSTCTWEILPVLHAPMQVVS